MTARTWPVEPDWDANIGHYIFFCSEYPREDPYEGSDGRRFWCSEQAFMLRKFEFCKNTELANDRVDKIIMIQPKQVIPIGEKGWEEVWEVNHNRARQIKEHCRHPELELDIEQWGLNKSRIMREIILNKFKLPRYAAILAKTNDRIIVEAAHYDSVFGIGLQ